MEGPSSVERIYLGDPNAPAELLWVTGIRTEMVDADGTTPQLPELMCHVNVDLDQPEHQALFGFRRAHGVAADDAVAGNAGRESAGRLRIPAGVE